MRSIKGISYRARMDGMVHTTVVSDVREVESVSMEIFLFVAMASGLGQQMANALRRSGICYGRQ